MRDPPPAATAAGSPAAPVPSPNHRSQVSNALVSHVSHVYLANICPRNITQESYRHLRHTMAGI